MTSYKHTINKNSVCLEFQSLFSVFICGVVKGLSIMVRRSTCMRKVVGSNPHHGTEPLLALPMGAAQWLPCAKAQDKIHDHHLMQMTSKGPRAQIYVILQAQE